MIKSKENHPSFLKSINLKLNKQGSINRPAKASICFTAINLLSKAAAFLFTPIFTRILTPAQYGEYSLFLSLLSITLAIGSLELTGGVIARVYQKYREFSSFTVLIASLITTVLTVLSVGGAYGFNLIFGTGMAFPFAYLFLLINAISTNIINIHLSKCRFSYRWVPSLLFTVIVNILSPVLSILIIKSRPSDNLNHISAKVGTMSICLLIIAAFIIFMTVMDALKQKSKQNLTRTDISSYSMACLRLLFRLALPMLPYYFSVNLISQADKLIIAEFISSEALGKYSVAYSAGTAASALTSGLCCALCPWIMRKVRAGEYKRVKSIMDIVISICTSLIICFLAVCPEIFSVLAPKSYTDALPVIFIIASVPIPIAITQCMSGIAIATERVKTSVLCAAFPAAISIGLGMLFIKAGGIVAAALITSAAYLLLSFLSMINTRLILGEFAVSVSKLASKLLLFATLSASIFIFREYIAIRAVIFILSALVFTVLAKSSFGMIREK